MPGLSADSPRKRGSDPLFHVGRHGFPGHGQQQRRAFYYSHDIDAMRRRRDTTGSDSTMYLWDRNNVFQEYDFQTGALNLHYTMEMTGDPVGNHPQGPSNVYSQRQVPTNSSSFYGFDLAGNTRLLMDGSGNISDTLLYSAFGEQLLRTGSTVFYYGFGGAAGYIGLDGQLFEARNRFYSPFNGIWLKLDPIGFEGGLWNLYGYVGNNPLRNIAP